jgi:Ca2+-binding EF-hand superfamily protein
MINGIGSSSGYQNYLQFQTMQNKPPDKAQMFGKLDTDGDGTLSQTELDTWASTMSEKTGQTIDTSEALTTYDSDGDGGLSSEEMEAFVSATLQQGMGGMGMMQGPPPPPGEQGLFDALDTDASGGISESELSTWAANMSEETGTTIDTTDAITTYDADGDGELSSTELKSFLEASGVPSPAGMASTDESESTSSSDTTQADGVLSQYDTNGDGVLSSSELQAYLDDQKLSSQGYVQRAMSLYRSFLGNSGNASAYEYDV